MACCGPKTVMSPTPGTRLIVSWRPRCCTSCGRRGVASFSLFCTWTWAMSGLASGSKVRVMVTLPDESLAEDM